MNVKQLIEKIEALPYTEGPIADTITINRNWILESIEQLAKPEKVKVPQFVAEKIEYFKKTGDWDLFQAMDDLFEHTKTCEWLEVKNNQEKFALAWIFGYEVEKEKRYVVKVKGICGNHETLNREKHSKKWLFSDREDNSLYKTKHTRKELEEANFGWVFDCEGVEVEEVE
jgi:hypothetical protein